MKRAVVFYKNVSSLWICVAVYLWALELRAVIGTDSEPVTVWLADCAAILLTLVFWVLVLTMALALAGCLVGRERFLVINRLTVKVCLIVVTALHFIRWLFNWQFFSTKLDVGLIVLTVGAAVLTILAIKRRRQKDNISESALPSLEDCFAFAALPVLFASIALIGVRVSGELISSPQGTVAMASDSRPAGSIDNRSSVILIVSDAMRAGSMSLYGHTRSTTPYLDRWSESATVFLDARINSTSTKPSMTTILTGKHPLSHGRLTKAQPQYRSNENLLQLLRDHGYFVGSVASNEHASLTLLGFDSFLSEKEIAAFEFLTLSWLRQHGIYPTPTGGRMYQNFAHFLWFLGYPETTSYYGVAADSLRLAKQFIARARKPFFLMLHIHEPHDPYDAPPPFRGKYARLDFRDVNEKIFSRYYHRYQPELQPFVDSLRDYYDEAIEYLDSESGKFAQSLQWTTRGRNSLLLITGDHGESFERGFLNHGEDLYESSVHVPLTIKFPNQQTGHRSSAPVQSIDLAPTILHTIGISIPIWIDGAPVALQEGFEARERVMINYKDPVDRKIYDRPTKVAIRWLQYKMIVSCDAKRLQLYDIANDPGEQTDLVRREVRLVKELWGRLEQLLANQRNNHGLECGINLSRIIYDQRKNDENA